MNRAILFGLVIMILSNPELQARPDFRDGFIITNNKDTIFGKIEYRSELNRNKSCLFRNDSGTKEYNPDQILAYGFINDKYFSSQIIEGLFTEVLVEGVLSLYKSGYDLYVLKAGDKLYKLESVQIKDTAMVKIQGGTESVIGYREDVRWKGILSVLTSDCVESYQTIQTTSLDEKNLTKFVIEYNLCKGASYKDFKSRKPWMLLTFGADAGVSLSVLKFTNKDYLHDYLPDSDNSWNPAFGLSFNISSPRVNERISLEADLYYLKAGFTSYITGNRSLATVYYETKIDITTLSVPIMIKYSFPAGKFSFFLNAGTELDSNFGTSSNLYTEVVSGTTVDSYESDAVNISKFQLGFVSGIGFARSMGKMKIGTELRYYKSAAVKTNTGYNWDLSRISLSIILGIR